MQLDQLVQRELKRLHAKAAKAGRQLGLKERGIVALAKAAEKQINEAYDRIGGWHPYHPEDDGYDLCPPPALRARLRCLLAVSQIGNPWQVLGECVNDHKEFNWWLKWLTWGEKVLDTEMKLALSQPAENLIQRMELELERQDAREIEEQMRAMLQGKLRMAA